MLSSILVRGGELLAAAVIAGAVLASLAWLGILWLRRRVRRRLQALALGLAGRAWHAGRSGGGLALPRPLRRSAAQVLARMARP